VLGGRLGEPGTDAVDRADQGLRAGGAERGQSADEPDERVEFVLGYQAGAGTGTVAVPGLTIGPSRTTEPHRGVRVAREHRVLAQGPLAFRDQRGHQQAGQRCDDEAAAQCGQRRGVW